MIDLKNFIEAQKINQTALSESLGITRNTLYMWLKENKPVQREKIITAIVGLSNNILESLKKNNITLTQTSSGNQSPNVQGENSIIINQGNEDLEAYKIAFNSIKKELEEMRESVRKKEAEINVLKIEIEKLRGNKNK